MANKLSCSSDEETPSSSSLRQDEDKAIDAGSNTDESSSQWYRCQTKAHGHIAQMSCYGRHSEQERAVPYCDVQVVKKLASMLTGIKTTETGQSVTADSNIQHPPPAGSSSSPHPDTAAEPRDIMDRVLRELVALNSSVESTLSNTSLSGSSSQM